MVLKQATAVDTQQLETISFEAHSDGSISLYIAGKWWTVSSDDLDELCDLAEEAWVAGRPPYQPPDMTGWTYEHMYPIGTIIPSDTVFDMDKVRQENWHSTWRDFCGNKMTEETWPPLGSKRTYWERIA